MRVLDGCAFSGSATAQWVIAEQHQVQCAGRCTLMQGALGDAGWFSPTTYARMPEVVDSDEWKAMRWSTSGYLISKKTLWLLRHIFTLGIDGFPLRRPSTIEHGIQRLYCRCCGAPMPSVCQFAAHVRSPRHKENRQSFLLAGMHKAVSSWEVRREM